MKYLLQKLMELNICYVFLILNHANIEEEMLRKLQLKLQDFLKKHPCLFIAKKAPNVSLKIFPLPRFRVLEVWLHFFCFDFYVLAYHVFSYFVLLQMRLI